MNFPMTRLIILALVALLVSDPVGAANHSKTMECENYVVGSKLKEKRSFFIIRHVVGSDTVEVKLKSNDNSVHPPENNAWKVLWKSEDNLRLVAIITQKPPEDGTFYSPVLALDIDYQKPWYRQVNLGGYLENNVKLVSSPWKRKCWRLD